MIKCSCVIACFFLSMLMSACNLSSKDAENICTDSIKNWEIALQEKLPLLGHRNWIVVTDMAYPLQNKPGIVILFADDTYLNVLASVQKRIQRSPHVVAVVYQDKEFLGLNDSVCLGIDSLKKKLNKILISQTVRYREHEQLISTLDSVSNLFQVVIIKTPLTKPYTSVFFELGCKYWQ